MFRTCTEGRGISSACGLLLHGRFPSHLSAASGRLRCGVTGVPPQPNSPPEGCLEASQGKGCRRRQRKALFHNDHRTAPPHHQGVEWWWWCAGGRKRLGVARFCCCSLALGARSGHRPRSSLRPSEPATRSTHRTARAAQQQATNQAAVCLLSCRFALRFPVLPRRVSRAGRRGGTARDRGGVSIGNGWPPFPAHSVSKTTV